MKLDIRDLSITMLGRDGAVVSCLWTQSQTFKGTPETATGRMTLVFKRAGKDWKAIHLHTSPDRPDPSRVLPSEQVPAATSSPTPDRLQQYCSRVSFLCDFCACQVKTAQTPGVSLSSLVTPCSFFRIFPFMIFGGLLPAAARAMAPAM